MKTTFVTLFLMILLMPSCIHPKKNGYSVLFEALETNTTTSIRALHVVDEKVIWAGGSGGSVLISEDGGKQWKINTVPGEGKNDFRSIYAWDKMKAIVFGVAGPAFAYRTEDGGQNWEVVFQDSTSGLFFNSLKFANEMDGLAVSDPIDGKFFVIRTEDGGKSWERVLDIPNVEKGEANFAASNTCIEFLPSGKAWIASGGLAARVFYSKDKGKSWSVSATPMIRGKASSGIFSIAFKNEREGVVVGGIYDEPEIATNIASYTVDGGETWQPSIVMPGAYRSCVQFVAGKKENVCFSIGKTGCDISFDEGRNWEFMDSTGFYTFRAIPGQLGGFAAGAKGEISKVTFVKE